MSKNGNKSSATTGNKATSTAAAKPPVVANASAPAASTAPVTGAAGAATTEGGSSPDATGGKKVRKPGPYAGKEAGSTVEYTLPSGNKISAVVTKDGHCACPTCSKLLATTVVSDVAKIAAAKDREVERIGGLQAEFKRIGEIIAKERARTGQPVLTTEELFAQVLAYKPEAEATEEPAAKAS